MNTLDQNSKTVAIIMIAALLFGHACSSAAGADESAAALKILRTKCGSCHHPKNPKAELDLSTLAGVLAGGESGLAIDEDAANSLLWEMVDSEVVDLSVLVEMATADSDGQKRFSPFWKIYVSENPLARSTKKQLNQLRSLGARIHND